MENVIKGLMLTIRFIVVFLKVFTKHIFASVVIPLDIAFNRRGIWLGEIFWSTLKNFKNTLGCEDGPYPIVNSLAGLFSSIIAILLVVGFLGLWYSALAFVVCVGFSFRILHFVVLFIAVHSIIAARRAVKGGQN